MPLLWNSQEDIFIGTLAPPCFLHLTKKLDMPYSEINHKCFTCSIQTKESPGVHQLMRKKSNNFRVLGTLWVNKVVELVTWCIKNNILKNIYDEDNEMEMMMIANYQVHRHTHSQIIQYDVTMHRCTREHDLSIPFQIATFGKEYEAVNTMTIYFFHDNSGGFIVHIC